MNRYIIFFAAILISISAVAKEIPKYPVSAIAEDMKLSNYAVIRESLSDFKIISSNKTIHTVKLVVTILNNKGKALASQYVWYDKNRKVNYLRAALYNPEGTIIKRIKTNEIIDHSAYDGYSMYSDNRIKSLDLQYNSFPYTIEFEYEVEMKYLYIIPDFILYDDDEVSIEKSVYSISYPKSLKPKYKLFNIKEPAVNTEGDKETISWAFENIKPSKFERFSPPAFTFIPTVIFSPNVIEYDGYSGKMDTWENLGKWQIQLNAGRDVLPEATKQKVRELTSMLLSREEKINALYNYVQNKTRYVSIQRGIGGMQPFEAKIVDQTGYGDCKALSNYMVALLKEAGIKGYYTQIYAGSNETPVSPDFPSDYFNHIVVAVPNERDTIWLECTSQTEPMGFLGKSTCDRYALMVTETAGVLVRTPAYTEHHNQQSRNATVIIDKSGNGTGKVSTTYSGLQYEHGGLSFYVNSAYDEQKKWLQKTTSIPSFDIGKFSMVNSKNIIPSATVNVDLTLNRLATVSGKRLFLTPNLMNRSTYIPEKAEIRKTNVVVKVAYTDYDTIHYIIPEEIYPEFLPEPVKIISRFGEYGATFTHDQGKIVYTRKLVMRKGQHPPEAYQELIDFYKQINKADHVKLVFLTKT